MEIERTKRIKLTENLMNVQLLEMLSANCFKKFDDGTILAGLVVLLVTTLDAH